MVHDSAEPKPAGPWEVAAWSVAAFLAGVLPMGIRFAGLIGGLVLAFTRLKGNPVARVMVPILGVVGELIWLVLFYVFFQTGGTVEIPI